MTNSYDEVAYPGFAFPSSHPGNLAAQAILHGLSPAPVREARVLEIGCGEGSNLIPMAYALPGARFTGFDLARLPIERGQRRIEDLELTNILLFEGDILTVGAELGQFDYILAHGVYAWVPKPVQKRLMALISELLAPHGIAFLSYNALPGCHMRRIVRDAMLFRAESISDPVEQVTAGIEFLDLVRQARSQVRTGDDFYSKMLLGQFDYLRERDPHATIHDELSEAYEPVTLLDFVGHARANGLDYVSESTHPEPFDPVYRPEIVAIVEQTAGPDPLRQEQMLDYIRARIYRETLLCRSGLNPSYDPDPAHLRGLFFASSAISSPVPDCAATRFTLLNGTHTDIQHAGAVAVLQALGAAWPRGLSCDELAQQIPSSIFAPNEDGLRLLLRLTISKLVEIRAFQPSAVSAISARPRASASARQEALLHSGSPTPRTSTLLHTTAMLADPHLRALLGLVDGTRDRAALLSGLCAAFPETPPQELEQGIERGLSFFLRSGLLEA